MANNKVIVALSGGVDSSVTAALLQQRGYEVIGVHMRLLSGAEFEGSDADARRVAEELGIEFHSLDCKERFSQTIIADFCSEYRQGRTPNPCVLCNRQLKFGYLLDVADQLGAHYLATGHYAQIDHSGEQPVLRRGSDRKKDQSYFLFTLTSKQLERVMFPLADLTKDEVRALAEKFNLSSRKKSESQDICFIPDNDYVAFLERQAIELPGGGDIIHVDGQVLGRHQGSHRYTIGQRRGLGIGWSEPLYVVAIDAQKKQVIVGEKKYLECAELVVDSVVWAQPLTATTLRVDCRIRYRHHEAPATLNVNEDHSVQVVFDEAQIGVTPGQAAVFYVEDAVIGGGWIR